MFPDYPFLMTMKKPGNIDKNCRNAADVQLHLAQLQVKCILMNAQKNI